MIKELFGLFKVITLVKSPVHFSYFEPSYFRLPGHIKKLLTQDAHSDGWLEAFCAVKNLTNSELKNIRLKLSVPVIEPLRIASNDPIRPVRWSYDSARRELSIERLDPKDEVRINFILEDSNYGEFSEPILIVDGKEFGAFQKIASSLTISFNGWWGLFFSVQLMGLAAAFGYMLFLASPCQFPNSDTCLLEKVNTRIVGGCVHKMIKVTTDIEKDLAASGFPLSQTIFFNGAKDINDLFSREKIAVCLPAHL